MCFFLLADRAGVRLRPPGDPVLPELAEVQAVPALNGAQGPQDGIRVSSFYT